MVNACVMIAFNEKNSLLYISSNSIDYAWMIHGLRLIDLSLDDDLILIIFGWFM